MGSLENTKSSRLFSESKELSPRRVGEETSEATASNLASQISSLRDDTDQKCMNEDEEAEVDDLASEVETDQTRQKIRRDLARFRRRLQERVQLLLRQKKNKDLCISLFFHIYCLACLACLALSLVLLTKIIDYDLGFFSSREICRKPAYWSKYCWLILNKFYKSRN